MRFLVDECTGPHVARHLSALGHDVLSVFDSARGAADDEVLARALAEQRILITNDRDSGDSVFRDGQPHCGIVLLRLEVEITGPQNCCPGSVARSMVGRASRPVRRGL